jgi:peptidoglycan/LPS O-acetylase OafA/YrhL
VSRPGGKCQSAFGVDIFLVISGFIICYISSLLLASVIAITACFLLAIASFRMVERTSNEFLRWRFIKHRPRVSAEASRNLNSIRAK